jgi:prepilin-type N-terminal cleavage/methylation domain-containing protein
MPSSRRGWTLIELLVVVAIIAILAAIALPRMSATKDKARMASLITDLRNSETAETSYFSDNQTFGTFGQLQTASNYNLSAGNTMTIVAGSTGYTATATNSQISKGTTSCHIEVGGGATSGADGLILCP